MPELLTPCAFQLFLEATLRLGGLLLPQFVFLSVCVFVFSFVCRFNSLSRRPSTWPSVGQSAQLLGGTGKKLNQFFVRCPFCRSYSLLTFHSFFVSCSLLFVFNSIAFPIKPLCSLINSSIHLIFYYSQSFTPMNSLAALIIRKSFIALLSFLCFQGHP